MRGGIGAAHEVRKPKSHVRCDGEETRQAVVARAADHAIESWDGSLPEFLADLDPGSKDDWVRAALGEPSKPD